MKQILVIDPGSHKCGLAILNENKSVTERKVIKTKNLHREVVSALNQFKITKIVLGAGTRSKDIKREIEKIQDRVPVITFPEAFSTLDARKRYWKENPPKGLWRLVPIGLLSPPRPYDDYVAVILGERFLDEAQNQTRQAGKDR